MATDPRPVRIALVQQAALSPDPERNLGELLAEIDRVGPRADFIMPTELATTPYFGVVRDEALKSWAQSLDSEAVRQVAERAARFEATIILPIYLDSGRGDGENVAIVIGPDGEIVKGQTPDGRTVDFFSKVHLPSAWHNGKGLDEPFYFTAGDHFPVFETPKAKVGALICYDRRFPEAWRSLVLAGAEIVFMPACVPAWKPSEAASTATMFTLEMQTRAVENSVFVAACCRAGEQSFHGVESLFIGQSCVIDPSGAVLEQAPSMTATTLEADIDLGQVARMRKRLTVLQDRRPETYLVTENPR